MYSRKGALAYAQVGVETGVMSASPHQLIAMLFDGAHVALQKAKWAIEQGDIPAKGRAISRAIDIIEQGLRAGLDLQRGGEIAQQLNSLYEYMVRTLLQANIRSDASLITQVEALLGDISSAWKEIGPAANAQQQG